MAGYPTDHGPTFVHIMNAAIHYASCCDTKSDPICSMPHSNRTRTIRCRVNERFFWLSIIHDEPPRIGLRPLCARNPIRCARYGNPMRYARISATRLRRCPRDSRSKPATMVATLLLRSARHFVDKDIQHRHGSLQTVGIARTRFILTANNDGRHTVNALITNQSCSTTYIFLDLH